MYLCRRLLISFRFTIEHCSYTVHVKSNWEGYLCPLIFSNKSIVMWMCVCVCVNVCMYVCIYVCVGRCARRHVWECMYILLVYHKLCVCHTLCVASESYVFVLSCFVVFIICIYVCVDLYIFFWGGGGG